MVLELDVSWRLSRPSESDICQTAAGAEAVADQRTAKARRLRHLPVEKGLLREVKAIQRILDSLVQCRVCASNPSSSLVLTEQFFEDDMRDENTVLAFRMLIKDLLVLFQAGNEGVCNILGE